MDGVPWELSQSPRGLNQVGYPEIFPHGPRNGSSTSVVGGNGKQRTKKHKDPRLDTISERPGLGSPSTSGSGSGEMTHAEKVKRDAQTSTSDLVGLGAEEHKKVQKGQINALAKMLSALRR